MADTDQLVAAELTKPSPRFIVISGDGPVAHGIENPYDIYEKYQFVSFPDTTDFIWDDPGHDFWILWAIDFTRRYNCKLESEMKKKQK